MNEKIEKLLSDAEGGYLEATDQSALSEYAASLEDRLRVMRSMQQHESTVVKTTMDRLWEVHPDMKVRHPQAYERGIRDMTLVYRYAAMAMVRDSREFLDQKLLHWFRTIIVAFEMEEPLQFAYAELLGQTEACLSAEDFSWVEPFLQRVQEVLVPAEEQAAE